MAPRYDVREVQDRGHYWQVIYDVTLEGGQTTEHGHAIPKDTLEWRAAEYDLNPDTDFETILDVVLAEPYIAAEEQVGRMPGEELYDAPDIATARARHIARCARAKLKHRISTRKVANGKGVGAKAEISNPFDIIRQGAVLDKIVMEIKKEHVRRTREENAARRSVSLMDSTSREARVAKELSVDLDALKQRIDRG